MIAHFWQRCSIHVKMLLSFLLVCYVTVVASGVIFYISSVRAIERRSISLVSNTVNQMMKNVDFYVADIERLSLAVFGDPTVQRILRSTNTTSWQPTPDDVNAMSYQMFSLSAPWSSVQGMYIFDNDGFLYYSTKGNTPKLDYRMTDEPWVAQVNQRTTPSALLWPTGTETTPVQPREQVFSLIRPINDIPTGNQLGYLKIDLNIKVMRQLLALHGSDAQSTRVLLLTDDGRVIYDNTNVLTGQRADDLQPRVHDLSRGRLLWRGQSYVYAAERSSYTQWTMIILLPSNVLLSEASQTGTLVLAIGITAMLLIGGLLYVVTRRIMRPLHVMAETMQRVEQGDLHVRVPFTPAPDEVGQLSRVFNTMLDSLERLITQVYEAQLREKDAQLLALQAQINPHFLFNTLNIMRALSRKHGAYVVGDIAEALADLFRYSMEGWDQRVPLHEELTHVEYYVTIQQIRFGDRFQFRCTIPPELRDAHVVKLSIQPLVENAITHGIARKSSSGLVTVSAERHADQLLICVADDGVGMDAATLEQLQQALDQAVPISVELPTAGIGIGLVNTNRRIKLLYGDQHGLTIESSPECGTTVWLRLPYIRIPTS